MGALSLVFLFTVVGLSVDLGWAYYLKVRVQTAADAAASAAAVAAIANGDSCSTVSCGTAYTCAGVTPPTTSLEAGCLYATTDAPPQYTVTMLENNTAPPGVSGNSPSMWVESTVSTTAHNFFLYLSGFQTASIKAQAVAGISTVGGGSCIYVLAPTGAGAYSMTGSGSVTVSGCALYVDSDNSQALRMTGSGSINGTVDIVGGDQVTGSGSINPAPNTGVASTADPFASIPEPSVGSCTYTNFTATGSSPVALGPGVYCGGISITGSGAVTMSTGTYIMNGGGFSMTGSGSLTATNAMIYNTAVGSYTIGAISFTGSGSITMSAPNSGPYEGIAFFQDRSYSTAASFTGSGGANITGSLYFPAAALSYTGSGSAQYTALIAYTLTMTGSGSFKDDPTGTRTGLARTTASLISRSKRIALPQSPRTLDAMAGAPLQFFVLPRGTVKRPHQL
jgi:Flp pilus assembly protein TadG